MSEQRNIIIDNIDFSEALRYLGYGNSTPDEKTKEILYNCADQLKSVMEGKYTYKVFVCRWNRFRELFYIGRKVYCQPFEKL